MLQARHALGQAPERAGRVANTGQRHANPRATAPCLRPWPLALPLGALLGGDAGRRGPGCAGTERSGCDAPVLAQVLLEMVQSTVSTLAQAPFQ